MSAVPRNGTLVTRAHFLASHARHLMRVTQPRTTPRLCTLCPSAQRSFLCLPESSCGHCHQCIVETVEHFNASYWSLPQEGVRHPWGGVPSQGQCLHQNSTPLRCAPPPLFTECPTPSQCPQSRWILRRKMTTLSNEGEIVALHSLCSIVPKSIVVLQEHHISMCRNVVALY